MSKTSLSKSLSLIKRPMMSEKTTFLNQYNQYVFRVDMKSNTREIKNAIENIYKVKVLKVNTSIIKGKPKMFKNNFGYRKNYKKAIVTLEEGKTIDSSTDIK